uniref:RING-type domain-containing protein n=1 Tax=Panagrellus redivivus TaxID=6233 RepID=A0A7E4WDN1_PANRE
MPCPITYCSLCDSDMSTRTDKRRTCQLTCGHFFHFRCVAKIVADSRRCPICAEPMHKVLEKITLRRVDRLKFPKQTLESICECRNPPLDVFQSCSTNIIGEWFYESDDSGISDGSIVSRTPSTCSEVSVEASPSTTFPTLAPVEKPKLSFKHRISTVATAFINFVKPRQHSSAANN